MKVVEKFISINGEGTRAGELAVFLRFKGCNLSCSYCDTTWANESACPYEENTPNELLEYVISTGVKNVTLTGGEPLLQKEIKTLIEILLDANLRVEIETNGSVSMNAFLEREPESLLGSKGKPESSSDIKEEASFSDDRENPEYSSETKKRPAFTMDYKLPSSGCEAAMNLDNMELLTSEDTVKFVAGNREDLEKALEIIERYQLTKRCHVYLSPVFGSIEPAQIVDFMMEHKLNDVRLQIQMHKVIWDPNMRGV